MIRRLRSKIGVSVLAISDAGRTASRHSQCGEANSDKRVGAMCLVRQEGLDLAPSVSLAIRGHRGCQSSPLTEEGEQGYLASLLGGLLP